MEKIAGVLPIYEGVMAGEIQNPRDGRRKDPYGAYNFRVQIEGIIIGGFSEVSGLKIETEVYPIREGGMNAFEHKLPKYTKFSDITLKKGITEWDLYDWYQEVINGNIIRKNGSIILYERGKETKLVWHFLEAYPVRWEASTFNAAGNAIATETLVLTHHGIYK